MDKCLVAGQLGCVWQFAQVVGYFVVFAVCVEGRVFTWQLPQLVDEECLWAVHVDVDVWHSSQVAGYAAGSALCVAGRTERWQVEQLVEVDMCLVEAQPVVEWHWAQVVGYFTGLEEWLAGRLARWQVAQSVEAAKCLKPQSANVEKWQLVQTWLYPSAACFGAEVYAALWQFTQAVVVFLYTRLVWHSAHSADLWVPISG